MKPALAEVGQRPTTFVEKLKERFVDKRILKLPDENGEWREVRGVNTLRRRKGESLSIEVIADYGPATDPAWGETRRALRGRLKKMKRNQRVVEVSPTGVPAYNTVATAFVIEQTGNETKDPTGTVIYSNTNPRRGNNGWHDNESLVLGILKSGVPAIVVDRGHALSFGDYVGLWRLRVPNEPTQYNSRDNYPAALDVLRGRRRDRRLIGEWIDPSSVRSRPEVVRNEAEGTVEFPIGNNDGYGNLKTAVRASDLPADLREAFMTTEELWLRVKDEKTGEVRRMPVKNRVAGVEPEERDLFFTIGSSGPKGNGYIEVNEFFGDSVKRTQTGQLTDTTTLVFDSPLVREPVGATVG